MNSGDLTKQRKDRIVYNSYVGQTKPSNKVTPARFETILQRRLGPHKVYDGSVVALPACECLVPPPEPDVTALRGLFGGLFAGTSTGNVYVFNGESWLLLTNVGSPVLSIEFTQGEGGVIYIITSTQVWVSTDIFTYSLAFTVPDNGIINGSTTDNGTTQNLYLVTNMGFMYYDAGTDEWISSGIYAGNSSAISSDGTNLYISQGTGVYWKAISDFPDIGGFTNTSFPNNGTVLFLSVPTTDKMYVATATNVYFTASPTEANSAIPLDPPITGTISCMSFLFDNLFIGTTSGETLGYDTINIPNQWYTFTYILGSTVNVLDGELGALLAGTPLGVFYNLGFDQPWYQLPFNT